MCRRHTRVYSVVNIYSLGVERTWKPILTGRSWRRKVLQRFVSFWWTRNESREKMYYLFFFWNRLSDNYYCLSTGCTLLRLALPNIGTIQNRKKNKQNIIICSLESLIFRSNAENKQDKRRISEDKKKTPLLLIQTRKTTNSNWHSILDDIYWHGV